MRRRFTAIAISLGMVVWLGAGDLKQASADFAWFVYNTATRPETMPRKPMPKPGAGRDGRGAGGIGQ